MEESNCCQYEPNILNRHGKKIEDIVDIQENQHTGTIQISLKGARIWIDAEISTSPRGIKPELRMRFIDDSFPHPGGTAGSQGINQT